MTSFFASSSEIQFRDSGDPFSHNLGIAYVEQCQSLWCWAACFEMIRACLGMPLMRQCEMANAIFPGDSCARACGTITDRSNSSADPNQVAGDCGLKCETASNLPFNKLTSYLDGHNPVELMFSRPLGSSGSGHVVLAVDYSDQGLIRIFDPNPDYGPSTIDYNNIMRGGFYHDASLVACFYNFSAR